MPKSDDVDRKREEFIRLYHRLSPKGQKSIAALVFTLAKMNKDEEQRHG